MTRCDFCDQTATVICEEWFHDGTDVITAVVTCDTHAWAPGAVPGRDGRFTTVRPIQSDEQAQRAVQDCALNRWERM
jgi:hypothetical protein